MIVTFRIFIGILVSASVLFLLLSLGALGYGVQLALQSFILIGILVWAVAGLFRNREIRPLFLLGWWLVFLFWLLFQALGQKMGMPIFIVRASWASWFSDFSMFLIGLGFYVLPASFLLSRKAILRFTLYFVGLSFLLAIFFIILASTSLLSVESLYLPPAWHPYVRQFMSLTIQPNNLVDLFYPGVFFALSYLFYFLSRERIDYTDQHYYGTLVLYFVFVSVLVAAIFLTKSRGGFLAFIFAFAIYCTAFSFSHQRKGRALQRFGYLVLLLIVFLLSLNMKEVIREFSTVVDAFNQNVSFEGRRGSTIGATLQLVKEKGLWGVGLGNFDMGWLLYHKPPFYEMPPRPYNDFLWLWAETGAVGIISFAGMLLVFVFRGLGRAIKTRSYFASYFLLACVCTVLTFCFHAVVDPTLYVRSLFWLMCIVLGVGASIYKVNAIEEGREFISGRGSGINAKILLVALIVITLIAGWIYTKKTIAFYFFRSQDNETRLLKAQDLDPWNSTYPALLARYYKKQYERTGRKENREQFLKMNARITELNPFSYYSYRERLNFYLSEKDGEGIRKTLALMRDRLPNFYQIELVISAFYLSAAIKVESPQEKQQYEAWASEIYKRAQRLNPNFIDRVSFAHHLTDEGMKRYRQLRKENKW